MSEMLKTRKEFAGYNRKRDCMMGRLRHRELLNKLKREGKL